MRLRWPDGDKLPERLLVEYPGLPLAVMTGLADRNLEERLKYLGAQTFLRKPFDVDDVVQQVRFLVGEGLAPIAEGAWL